MTRANSEGKSLSRLREAAQDIERLLVEVAVLRARVQEALQGLMRDDPTWPRPGDAVGAVACGVCGLDIHRRVDLVAKHGRIMHRL